ncbi:MAG: serine hydrolase [Proteobacteria bacterium]|nr:MAG: serine hydrolase [Pseudomonadota bacterium]
MIATLAGIATSWIERLVRGTPSRGSRAALVAAIAAAAFAAPAAHAGGKAAASTAVLGEIAAPVRASLKEQLLIRDPAPLWQWLDPDLEEELAASLADLGLATPLRAGKLAVALVDITDPTHPRVAALNGDLMLYAASLPKIAVMLGIFQKAAEGKLVIDGETRGQLLRMIRRSSNPDATALMHKAGHDFIARTLISPRYRLYDPFRNGGLWAGKDYASAGAWRRDPIDNLSHGATPMQIARFFYLLQTGRLVNAQASAEMKEILGHSAIHHKFVRGLELTDPTATVYRKSGTWGISHADGALVERRDGAVYIAAGIAEDAHGGEWLSQIIIQMNRLIDRHVDLPRVRRTNVPGASGPLSVSTGG